MSSFQDPLLLLVAYSDGELAAEATAALEMKLAASADLRNRLEDVRTLQASLRTHLPAAPTQLDAAHRKIILQLAQPLRVRNWWAINSLAAACLVLGMIGVGLLVPSINMVRESASKSRYAGESLGNTFSVVEEELPARADSIHLDTRSPAAAAPAGAVASLDAVEFVDEVGERKFMGIGAGGEYNREGLRAKDKESQRDSDAGKNLENSLDSAGGQGRRTDVTNEIDGLAKKAEGRLQAAADRPANSPTSSPADSLLKAKPTGDQNDLAGAVSKDNEFARVAPASPPPASSPAVAVPQQESAAEKVLQAAKPVKRERQLADSVAQAEQSFSGGKSTGKPGEIAVPLRAIPLSEVIDSGFSRLRNLRAQGYHYRVNGDTIDILGGLDVRPQDPTETFGLNALDFSKAFGTQPMVVTQDSATLTCAFTADTASFERAAALLRQGQAVDAASIQAEHFVNATPLDYPAASGPEAFSLYAEAGPSPFSVGVLAPRTALVSVGAVARPAGINERRPLALTLAIDCSGSMAQSGGLERIQAGLHELIMTLGADDTVAIVAFGDRARIVLPATPGSQRERLLATIAGLQTGGSTNAGEGLNLAYQLAAERAKPGRESRVLLATDGATLAGDGAVPILARIAADRARGISLIVVGCGEQQYESTALDALAAKGDGQHLYVGSNDEARELFRTTLQPQKLGVLARDAKVQVTWNPQRVSHARLIGYETRRLKAQDFRDDRVDAGEISHDTQATALFEVILTEGGSGPLGSAAVRYFDTRLEQVRELACPLPGSVVQSRLSPRLRLLACSADLAELLAQSFWANQRGASYARLLAELERCPPSSFRDHLHAMATQAQALTGEP